MDDSPRYRYVWRNNAVRRRLYGRTCRVVCRGTMNSAEVVFDDGERQVISRSALRRVQPAAS
jgi:hypothetical protein